MSRADFDNFLRRKHEKEADPVSFSPEEQLREWFEYLDHLYKTIENFLSAYIADQSARLEFSKITINEDFSGPYEVRRMFLHVGGSVIVFEPLGTMLIGSKGRVDVQGPRGKARLSLVNEKVSDARQLVQVRVSINGEPPPPVQPAPTKIVWTWKIITPAPEFKFLELTEDNFFDMVLGVSDV